MSEKVAIVGATGAVGAELLEVLERRDFPMGELRLFASSRSAGRGVSFRGTEIAVEEMRDGALDGTRLAFFSAGSAISGAFAREAAGRGTIVIDNSSAFRMDDDVPLVVPEINGDDVDGHRNLIANPNCSTIIFVMVLAPITRICRVPRAVVCTYQAVSGAGAGGMQALKAEVAGAPPTGEVFPHPIAHNIIPEVGGLDGGGVTEEEAKMERETRKILHDDAIRIASTCVRVPVYRALSEAVHLETDRPVEPEEVRRALEAAEGVLLVDAIDDHAYPTPGQATEKDDVLVGRIRRDGAFDPGVALFISGDQLRKGAALNAVQIAERCL